ncbi:hypothetical protein ACJ5NV_06650 [Loktanella agnita]|uniref:hypothetical protein n=1 Tax=Loktanella agnita TaxID=287097 RepID=UPI00398874DC
MMEELDEILAEEIESHSVLEVHKYRGLHLNKNVDNRQTIDDWLERSNDRIALEKLLNHLHVYDLASLRDYSEETYQRIADELERNWRKRLAALDGQFVVERYEDYGPTLTFYFDGTRSASESRRAPKEAT